MVYYQGFTLLLWFILIKSAWVFTVLYLQSKSQNTPTRPFQFVFMFLVVLYDTWRRVGVCVLCKWVCMEAADGSIWCAVSHSWLLHAPIAQAWCMLPHDAFWHATLQRLWQRCTKRSDECSIRDWHWTGISALATVVLNH